MGGRGSYSQSSKVKYVSLEQPIEDMDFYHPVKRDSLLNLTWSDGGPFEKGVSHDVIPNELKGDIKFWRNDVYQGVEAVTYKGRVVYIDKNGLKTANQSKASAILRGIKEGYQYDDYLFRD